MTDFDQFERGLAAALCVDADETISRFDPAAVARAAITSHRRRAVRRPWSVPSLNHAKFSLAATLAFVVVGGAFYLFATNRSTIGPSVTPEPSPTKAEAASPAATVPAIGRWTAAANMREAHSGGHTATRLADGTVLIAGGGAALTSAELYDPVDARWTATGSLTNARTWHAATLLRDGRVLVVGGFAERGAGLAPGNFPSTLASAELYDPATGTWTVTGSMADPRIGHTATLLPDGRVLVVGGSAPQGVPYERFASAELYDPTTGEWTPAAAMLGARDGHSATLLPNEKVLVAGGDDGDRTDSAELYDPLTGTWTVAMPMPEPFHGHTATLLANGTVLVAGGDAPTGPGARGWAHAALYDPATDAWTATQDMLRARLGHTATLLPGGDVLVSGGRAHGGLESEAFNDAELYGPAAGTWTAAAGMHSARSQHSAVLLADGRVLVLGGYGADGQPTAAAELFDPLGGP